jgi:hypothetical protein
MKKIPVIMKVKELIDSLEGKEFDSRLVKHIKFSSEALSTLTKKGYIKVIGETAKTPGQCVSWKLYQVTGKPYVKQKKAATTKIREEEVLIFGKYKLSEMPKGCVTVHKMEM